MFTSESQNKQHRGEIPNELEIGDIPDFSLSLCGRLEKIKRAEDRVKAFISKQISYETFSENPTKFMGDADLRVKVGESVYQWEAIAPQILCNLAFKQELDQKTKTELNQDESKFFGLSKTKAKVDFEE